MPRGSVIRGYLPLPIVSQRWPRGSPRHSWMPDVLDSSVEAHFFTPLFARKCALAHAGLFDDTKAGFG